jgi:hypothetical protein
MPLPACWPADEDYEATAASGAPRAAVLATAAVLPASPQEGILAVWPEGLASAAAGSGGDFALTRAEEL